MPTYFEKLRDPRWQRRRLEILSKSAFCCESCGDSDKTLHVHHKIYRKGTDPWDYSDTELTALCELCHKEDHRARSALSEALIDCCLVWQVTGYALAINAEVDGRGTLNVENYEVALGIADAFGLIVDDVLNSVDANHQISHAALRLLADSNGKNAK